MVEDEQWVLMVFLWEDKEENASKDRRTLLPIVRIKMGPNKNANRQIKIDFINRVGGRIREIMGRKGKF